MEPAIDAPDEDNNDDDNGNDGHDEREGITTAWITMCEGETNTMGVMLLKKIIGFTVPLNAARALRPLLAMKTISALEVQRSQVRQQFIIKGRDMYYL